MTDMNDRDQRLSVQGSSGSRDRTESSDGINEHIRRWEQTLTTLNAKTPFCLMMRTPAHAGSGVLDHFIVFHEHRGERRLVEVKLLESPPGASEERALAEAPREVRVEVLRRLPKAFEGALIREQVHASAS
jgi:hypothetical protein